jgi:pimeloyl-ACP methyl ester carboxylesterase
MLPVRALLAPLLVLGGCRADDGGNSSSLAPPADIGPTAPIPGTSVTSGAPQVTEPPETTAPPTTDPPVAVPAGCPAGFPQVAVCSTVSLPADRDDPAAGQVVLPVAVAPATGDNPQRRAIVVPGGGPGYSGLDDLPLFASTPWRATHDIVTYDQRGTGLAVPSLECPERDEAFIATLQRVDPAAAEHQAVADAMDTCRARLEAEGVDLGDYDSEASAADLDDLRRALGYEQWTIVGISYGGRLALATMRSHPDGVASVILDSVYDVTYGGLDAILAAANRGIDHLAASCAAQPACAAAHPDLAGTIEALRQRYNAEPWRASVDIGDGEAREFVLTGDDLMAGLFNALYDDALIPALPMLIEALAAGDTAVVPTLLREGVRDGVAQADVMARSVDCADNAGLPGFAEAEATALADPGRLASLVTTTGVPSCAEWAVEQTPGAFNEPVTSDIPALVLAGSFDPITPPQGTRAVASHLANSVFLEFPAESHAVTPHGPCEEAVTVAFLTDPRAELDTSCVDQLTPPTFA